MQHLRAVFSIVFFLGTILLTQAAGATTLTTSTLVRGTGRFDPTINGPDWTNVKGTHQFTLSSISEQDVGKTVYDWGELYWESYLADDTIMGFTIPDAFAYTSSVITIVLGNCHSLEGFWTGETIAEIAASPIPAHTSVDYELIICGCQ